MIPDTSLPPGATGLDGESYFEPAIFVALAIENRSICLGSKSQKALINQDSNADSLILGLCVTSATSVTIPRERKEHVVTNVMNLARFPGLSFIRANWQGNDPFSNKGWNS